MAAYPTIERLFANNRRLLASIAKDDPHGFARWRGELVISQALKAGVAGVDKLVRDSGGNCSKFINLTHEVMVALCLQRLPANVSILDDCAFGSAPIYTPDIEISTIDGRAILVEVTCRSNGATAMDLLVHEMVKNGQFPFRISYALGPALSSSAISHDDRKIQEETAQRVIELATREFAKLSATPAPGLITIRAPEQAPEITLGAGVDEAWDAAWGSGDIIACFRFEPTTAGEGYASGGVTSARILPDDELRSAFLHDIKRKAVRRENLPAEKRKLPFVVAYVSEEWALRPGMTNSALTGHRAWLSSATNAERKSWVASSRAKRKKEVQAAIERAYQNGWGSTLDDWGHGSEGLMAFYKDGLYLDAVHMHDFAWGSKLTGVVVLRNNGTHIQWIPNPFSEDASTTSWLQEVGLPQGRDGEEVVFPDDDQDSSHVDVD
ncbi:hypothetical protein [Sorangium sp. So ce693]|uniref:hypothetical protein n=1 Tax=Sorangium sp. So ce693 TaxID=3133318 RepID=UPI003F5F2B1F